jgi:hypothetical protein
LNHKERREPSAAEPQHHWRAAILAAAVLILHAFGLWLERWMGSRLLRPGWPRADTLGEIFAPREDSDVLQYKEKCLKGIKSDMALRPEGDSPRGEILRLFFNPVSVLQYAQFNHF